MFDTVTRIKLKTWCEVTLSQSTEGNCCVVCLLGASTEQVHRDRKKRHDCQGLREKDTSVIGLEFFVG